ncbi:hypothetical protein V6N13_116204 [Hibiscus sabdariffa]
MFLQLNSADGAGRLGGIGRGGCGAFHGQIFPLGLSLEQAKGGFLKQEASARGKCFRNGVVDGINSSVKNWCDLYKFPGFPWPANFREGNAQLRGKSCRLMVVAGENNVDEGMGGR